MGARRITTSDGLGQVLRDRRKDLGWTQTDLALKAGTTQTMISRLERGSVNPMLDTILAITAALGLELRVGTPNASGSAFPWEA